MKPMQLFWLGLAHRQETLASADRVIVLQRGCAESVVLRQWARVG